MTAESGYSTGSSLPSARRRLIPSQMRYLRKVRLSVSGLSFRAALSASEMPTFGKRTNPKSGKVRGANWAVKGWSDIVKRCAARGLRAKR